MSTTHFAQDSRQLAGTRWRLDLSGSSAEFRVPNVWGLGSVKGRFQRLDGRLELDGAAIVDQRQLGMTFSRLGAVRSPTALSVHARLRREH
jgi:polyisoprenoid-binding protein YceI